MFLPDCLTAEFTEFRGPQLRLDPYTIPTSYALAAQNVSYLRGQVGTRYGHSLIASPGDAITTMFNFLFNNNGGNMNTLVWYATGVGIRYCDLTNIVPTIATIIAQTTAYGANFATAGSRLYAAFFNSAGNGAAQGQVYSWGVGADKLFARPPLVTTEVTVTTSEGAANSGSVTGGAHRVGFFLTTRNGYTTKLGPLNTSLVYTPTTFTASGGRTATFTFTPQGGFNWPTGATLQAVMTTGANLNRHYAIPGATQVVAGAITYNLTISISDDDLAATATDVTLQQNLLSQDASGNGPFSPSNLFTYGSRMGYVGVDPSSVPVCYFSEPSAYQTITAAQHGVYLPGQLQILAGFSLRGVAYLLGPHWTYSTSDGGGVPATWATPQLVDGAIGTLSPRGVIVNASQGYAWVVDEGGLYLFMGGQFPDRPVSYYQQTDWQRINWGAANVVEVVDDKDNKRVVVKVPLDGATSASHQMAFDYTDGTSPEAVKYSLDNVGGYSLGAIAMVQHPTTKMVELWAGASSGGTIIRKNNGLETNPYRDVASAYTSIYEPGILPGLQAQRGTVHAHHADHLRIKGNGAVSLLVWGLDHAKSVTPALSPLTLSSAPGKEYLIKYSMIAEHVSLQFSTSALDAWFVLSKASHYYNLHVLQR